MPTMERRVELWGGPEDGVEVKVQEGTFTYFIPGPPKETWDPETIILDPRAHALRAEERLMGRYQWSETNKRFEWKGYE